MYATAADMIERFGLPQMIRLSQPENRDAEAVDAARIETALVDATAVIDSYIRGRYALPIAQPPKDIVRATCILARYDLAQGERMDPSEEMAKARKDIIGWLESIARELVTIDAPLAQASGASHVGSGPRVTDRPRDVTYDSLRGY